MEKADLIKILEKRAKGFEYEEEVIEKGLDGESTKSRLTRKYCSPDLVAVKMLLEIGDIEEEDYDNLTLPQIIEKAKESREGLDAIIKDYEVRTAMRYGYVPKPGELCDQDE